MHGGGISFETRIPDRYARRFRLPLNIVRMYTHTRFRRLRVFLFFLSDNARSSALSPRIFPVENKIRGEGI